MEVWSFVHSSGYLLYKIEFNIDAESTATKYEKDKKSSVKYIMKL